MEAIQRILEMKDGLIAWGLPESVIDELIREMEAEIEAQEELEVLTVN